MAQVPAGARVCSRDDERPQRPQHTHPHKQSPTNERVATYSVMTLVPKYVKAPLAIEVICLPLKFLRATGCVSRETERPITPEHAKALANTAPRTGHITARAHRRKQLLHRHANFDSTNIQQADAAFYTFVLDDVQRCT